MKYVIINEGTISIKRIMCNILIVYFTRKQWGNTDNLFISMALYGYTVIGYCWHNYMVWDGNGHTGARRNIRTGGGEPKMPPICTKRPPPPYVQKGPTYMYTNAPHMVKKGPNKDENVAKGPHMEKRDPHMVKKVPHKEKNVPKRPPHGKISST